jgi:hypothetical protein
MIAGALIIMNGCSQNSNPISSTSDTIKSGTLQYTFSTPKALYGIHDTLNAAFAVYNDGVTTDTIAVGDGLFRWSLQNVAGKTIMFGGGSNNVVERLPINPGQRKQIYFINQIIADTSGKAVVPGSYSLNAALHTTLSFSLKLSIQ